MKRYHVFIERPRNAGAVSQVAQAIADRYGLPVATLVHHLNTARFRVKANIDLAKATTIARDLESLGAVCSVVDDATGQTVDGASPSATPSGAKKTMFGIGGMKLPAPGPAAPQAQASRSPAGSDSDMRATGTAKPGRRDGAKFQSGLSAAAMGIEQDLGALGNLGAIALTQLDSRDEAAPEPPKPLAQPTQEKDQFAPQSGSDGGPIGLAATDIAPIVDRKPKNDQFAPPSASDGGPIGLAADIAPIRERRPARGTTHQSRSTQPAAPPSTATRPGQAKTASGIRPPLPQTPSATHRPPTFPPPVPGGVVTPPLATTHRDSAPRAPEANRSPIDGAWNAFVDRAWNALVRNPRLRLLTGVFASLLIGFLPVHMISSARENAAFAEIDDDIRDLYNDVTSTKEWQELDGVVAEYRGIKRSRRVNIAITAILLWAMFGGGLGFVWFRKIPWGSG